MGIGEVWIPYPTLVLQQWWIQEFEKGVSVGGGLFKITLIFISYATPGAHIGVFIENLL